MRGVRVRRRRRACTASARGRRRAYAEPARDPAKTRATMPRGRGEPLPRRRVVRLEEAHDEPRPEDEPDAVAAAVVDDAQRGPRLGVRRPVADAAHDASRVGPRAPRHAEVARDRADRAAGREGDRRQRAAPVRACERADAGHVRAVAACQHDAAAAARRDAARDVLEIPERARLVHARAALRRGSTMTRRSPPSAREPARLAVDNDVGAGAHGNVGWPASTRRRIGLRPGAHGERARVAPAGLSPGALVAALLAAPARRRRRCAPRSEATAPRSTTRSPSRESAGTLSNGDAAALAREVAERGARAPRRRPRPPPASATLLACAHELDDALADRMRVHDAAGADAALARIAGRGLSLGDARDFASDADSALAGRRRARARPTRGPRRAPARARRRRPPRAPAGGARGARRGRRARTSRRSAKPRASIRSPSSGRRPCAPSPRCRATPGGQAADLLRDLWTGGDDGLREDIALAWAAPAIWDAGRTGSPARARGLRSGSGRDRGGGRRSPARRRVRRVGAGRDRAARALHRDGAPAARACRPSRRRPSIAATCSRRSRHAASDEDLEVRVGALARLASRAARRRGRDRRAQAPTPWRRSRRLRSPASPWRSARASPSRAPATAASRPGSRATLSAPAPEDRLGAATSLGDAGGPSPRRAARAAACADARRARCASRAALHRSSMAGVASVGRREPLRTASRSRQGRKVPVVPLGSRTTRPLSAFVDLVARITYHSSRHALAHAHP